MLNELKHIAKITPAEPAIKAAFLNRLNNKAVSRDENKLTHFCIYFAAYDPDKQLVFIGRHIKSGLWLFNGGHLDKNESAVLALNREINEEWGSSVKIGTINTPRLLTITLIDNPIQPCKTHFDIWYFLAFDSRSFNPDPNLLAKEFHEWGWYDFSQAQSLVKDKNTLAAIGVIEEQL
jgi:8-oxo-dGTP pyrophosphatase MutT (NUDIX family)